MNRSRRRALRAALFAIAAAGFLAIGMALIWEPTAHSSRFPDESYTEPCARGWNMWLYGASSDGSSDHGPKGAGEQVYDPVWEAECRDHLATIQTVVGAAAALVLAAGVPAVVLARRWGKRAGDE